MLLRLGERKRKLRRAHQNYPPVSIAPSALRASTAVTEIELRSEMSTWRRNQLSPIQDSTSCERLAVLDRHRLLTASANSKCRLGWVHILGNLLDAAVSRSREAHGLRALTSQDSTSTPFVADAKYWSGTAPSATPLVHETGGGIRRSGLPSSYSELVNLGSHSLTTTSTTGRESALRLPGAFQRAPAPVFPD